MWFLAVALLDKLNEQPVSPLGPAPEGSQPAPVHLCDRLVANPFDPQRATDGTPWRLITPLSAREACTAALETYPDEARFQYQLARVDHFTGNFEAAIPIFEQLSNDGYVAATNNLATMYLNGEGVDLDTDEARRLFLEAAARDYAPAMNNIGWMYQASLGVEENFSEALEWYRRGADLGYATAMTNIGWMFQAAIGVERDFEEAMKWYTRAAENGNAIAMANIGWMHQKRPRCGAGLCGRLRVVRRGGTARQRHRDPQHCGHAPARARRQPGRPILQASGTCAPSATATAAR